MTHCSQRIFSLVFIAALLFPVPARVAEFTAYGGACDGSAGASLDENHFVVADDDSNDLLIYRKGEAAHPVERVPMKKFLGVENLDACGNEREEADIEGAARVGDRIYWIGSHGRDSKGCADPNRSRFFATRIIPGPSPTLKAVGAPFRDLRKAMFEDHALASLGLEGAYGDENAEKGPKPESENGFNIEGLAAYADGQLLIAFRNPRPNGSAVIVPLRNPKEVVDNKARPVFGPPTTLDLGGRGIRSIERVGERYLIVAGPRGDVKDAPRPAFQLRSWSGPGETTTKIEIDAIELIDDEFGPEALLALPGGAKIMLLYDEGDRKAHGEKCKKRADKSFSARELQLAPAPGKQ